MAKEKKRKAAARSAPTGPDLSWIDSRWFPWGVAGTYLIIVLLLFSDFVFSGLMLYGSDTLQAAGTYFREFYVTSIHNGHFPTWSPYIFGGMPFVDAFHSDIFYPFTISKFFLSPERARGWELVLHFWFGGIFMYLTARGWRLSRLAAAVSGLAYMTATYYVSMVHPGHDGKIYVTTWFPLGFLFLKKIWDTARPRDMAIFALIVGVIILTPHVQMAYFALWAYGGYSVYRIVQTLKNEKRFPWLSSFGALAAVLVAVGISAVQFYPGYSYVKNYSPRAGEGRGFEYASSWSLHQEEIVSEVVPDFSGVASKDSNTYWGRNFFKDNSEYGGLVALLLAVFAVFRTRFKDRWFFFGLGVFAAVYGLGAHTPLFKLFYYVVPNVKQMRAPSMIMFLYLFSIVLCAGAAIDALMEKRKEKRSPFQMTKLLWIIAAVLGALALLLTIAPAGMMSIYTGIFFSNINARQSEVLSQHLGTIVLGFWLATLIAAGVAYFAREMISKRALWAVGGIVVLILFDNVRMDRKFIAAIDLDTYLPHSAAIDFLQSKPQPFRVLPVPRGFPTNYFAYYNIPEMTGYHGNQLKTYNDFLGGSVQPRMFSRRALDLDDVRYVIFRRGANLSEEPNDPTLKKVFDQSNIVIFENVLALPHARLVTCWELHDPADTLYTRIYDADFDYRNCVVVDSALPFESVNDTLPPGTVGIVKYDLEDVEVKVDAAREALLVLADNNYPAWHATVDGEPAPIITTDATFRGVVVPAGSHTVRFEYHSEQLRIGAWVTIISVLLAGLVIGLDALTHRRRTT